MESRRGCLLMLMTGVVILPPGPTVFGSGNRLSSFCPLGSMRLAGTILPGKGTRGKRVHNRIRRDFAKIAWRSSAVGKV